MRLVIKVKKTFADLTILTLFVLTVMAAFAFLVVLSVCTVQSLVTPAKVVSGG